jgi:hypothetical protein
MLKEQSAVRALPSGAAIASTKGAPKGGAAYHPGVGGTEQRPPISARILVASAFRDLLRPPFSLLLGIGLLISLVESTVVAADPAATPLALVLLVMWVYLGIAFTLAAASKDPGRSADSWIKAALRRRVFWRAFGTGLVATLLVLAGAVAFIVGAFVVGAIVALAEPAAVLERKNPIEAIRRSAELTRPARVAVGIIFGALVLIPSLVLLVLPELALNGLGPAGNLAGLALVVLWVTGTIALARAFVTLGGEAPGTPDAAAVRG